MSLKISCKSHNTFLSTPSPKISSIATTTHDPTDERSGKIEIIGLAFYELAIAGPDVEIEVPLGSNELILIITLYDAYHPGFRQHYDANISLKGDGKKRVVRIIWATYNNRLIFSGLSSATRVEKLDYKG